MIDIDEAERHLLQRIHLIAPEWSSVPLLAKAGTHHDGPARQLSVEEFTSMRWVPDLVEFGTNVQNRLYGRLDQQDRRWLFTLKRISKNGRAIIIGPLTKRMVTIARRNPLLRGMGTPQYTARRILEINAVFVYFSVLAEQVCWADPALGLAVELLRRGHLSCGADSCDDHSPILPESMKCF